MEMNEKKQALLDAVYRAYFIDRYTETDTPIREVSRDFESDRLDLIGASEALVGQVRRSELPAIDVERALDGVRVGEPNPIWDAFFTWYESFRVSDRKAFELCVESQILEGVAKEEGLIKSGRLLRLSRWPTAVIGQSGFCEAELVNRFVSQVRRIVKSRHYAMQVKSRLAVSRAILERVKRFVKMASSNNLPYCPVCAELVLPGLAFSSQTLSFSLDRFQSFIEVLRAYRPSGGVLRLFWAVEFLSEIGFRFQVVFWFDARLLSFQAAMSLLLDSWAYATGVNLGSYAVFHPRLNRPSHLHRYWETGWHWLAQLDEIQQLLSRDRYIRLRAPESQALYGFERLEG